MKPRSFAVLLTAVLVLTAATGLQAQKIKIIVDQDARGPATTDMQSILIFLQSDKFDVLGITTVSGDQWVKRRNPAHPAPARNRRPHRRSRRPGRRVPAPELQGGNRALGSALRQIPLQRLLERFLQAPGKCSARIPRRISRPRCGPSPGRGRASHQAAGRNRRPLYRSHGAQVSRRSRDLGGRPPDQYRAGACAWIPKWPPWQRNWS